MTKISRVGKLGIHNVYRTRRGTYAIAQYSNITQIIPVKKERWGRRVEWIIGKAGEKRIRSIKRTGTFNRELKYAKKLIS